MLTLPSPVRARGRSSFGASTLALGLLLLFAAPASAGDFRSDDSVTVGQGETVSDDLYIGTGTATINGTVDGDLTVAGGTVTVGGQVTGSLNAAGGTIDIGGEVGGAVRVAGGTVRISGTVGRDVVAFGGTVTLDSAATIGGDVAGGVGQLTLNGQVAGDVLAGAGTIEIFGTVDGSVEVAVETLRIGDAAVIGDDVTYTSDSEASISQNAQIGGAVTRNEPESQPAGADFGGNPILGFLGLLLGLLVLGWGLLLVRPRLLLGSAYEVRTRPLIAFGAGLIAWVGQILLVIALFLLAIAFGAIDGALGGAFALPATAVILLIAVVAMVASVPLAMAIGTLIIRDGSPYLAFAVGAVIWAAVLTLAGVVSGALGFLVYLFAWIVGLGAFVLYAWRTRTEPYVAAWPPSRWTAPPAAPMAPPPPQAAAPPPAQP